MSSWQWWCSAQTAAWEWTWQAYPGVWIFIAAIAGAYGGLRRWVRRRDADPSALGGVGHVISFAAGLLMLWIALDWPIGALGAGYLASVHMVQFLLIALIAPPLLLHGIPPGAYHALANRRWPMGVLRWLTHPLIALAFYTVIVYTTHAPTVNDTLMATQLGSFAIDILWLGGAAVFWWPVMVGIPERPAFHPITQVAYLTASAILMTPIFLFLTFSEFPVYAIYELSPQVHGISAMEDQALAGLIMKIAGGMILMVMLTVIFFRWSSQAIDRPELKLAEAANADPAPRREAARPRVAAGDADGKL
jgi:cytochrome c oxidase assembly factor CtaG